MTLRCLVLHADLHSARSFCKDGGEVSVLYNWDIQISPPLLNRGGSVFWQFFDGNVFFWGVPYFTSLIYQTENSRLLMNFRIDMFHYLSWYRNWGISPGIHRCKGA